MVKGTASDLSSKATGAVASVQGAIHGAVEGGKTFIDNQKEAVHEGVEAGKEAHQKKKDELTASIEGGDKPAA